MPILLQKILAISGVKKEWKSNEQAFCYSSYTCYGEENVHMIASRGTMSQKILANKILRIYPESFWLENSFH